MKQVIFTDGEDNLIINQPQDEGLLIEWRGEIKTLVLTKQDVESLIKELQDILIDMQADNSNP